MVNHKHSYNAQYISYTLSFIEAPGLDYFGDAPALLVCLIYDRLYQQMLGLSTRCADRSSPFEQNNYIKVKGNPHRNFFFTALILGHPRSDEITR